MIVEAALSGSKEAACQAIMLDPLTSALLTLDDMKKMADEMLDAESKWLSHME